MTEILVYIIAFMVVIIVSLGLFGVFDNNEDNPFKNK